ncbi:unnamed protein product [Sympodiomycopsis kandeliae]
MTLNHHDTLAAVHAFIACLATIFLIPAAILVARFQRDKNPRWVRIHVILNIWATIFIIIAFGLGVASVMLNPEVAPPDDVLEGDENVGKRSLHRGIMGRFLRRQIKNWMKSRHAGHGDDDGDDDDDDDGPEDADAGDDAQFIGPEATFHHKMGLVLFILICLQVAWGFTTRYLAHSQAQRKIKKRVHRSTIGDDGRSLTPVSIEEEMDQPAINGGHARGNHTRGKPARHWTQYLHMVAGILLLILFWVQAWNGLHKEWPAMSETGDPVPTAVLVLFWILIAIPIAPYLIHLVSKVLHKSHRSRDNAQDDDGKVPESLVMERSDHADRIVVGGPSSAAALREQMQEQEQEERQRESQNYETYGSDNRRHSRGLPRGISSRGSI